MTPAQVSITVMAIELTPIQTAVIMNALMHYEDDLLDGTVVEDNFEVKRDMLRNLHRIQFLWE